MKISPPINISNQSTCLHLLNIDSVIACNDNEPLFFVDAIDKMIESLSMLRTKIEVFRVRRQIKWIFIKTKI